MKDSVPKLNVAFVPPRVGAQVGLGWVWLVFAAGLSAIGLFALGGEAAACLVLLAALAPAVLLEEFRNDGRLAIAFLLSIAAHIVVAVVNSYLGTTLGSGADAGVFHATATGFAQAMDVDWKLAIGSDLYIQLLGFMYRALGASILLGDALSILAFSWGCVLVIKILGMLGTERRAGTLAFFGLLPSGIMFLSVTLREAYQLTFFLAAVYASLQMRERGLRWAVPMLVSAVCLALFHNGLTMYAGFLVISSVTWSAVREGRGGNWRRLIALSIAAALVVLVITRMPGMASSVDAVSRGRAFEYADQYRRTGAMVEARTTYGLTLDSSSFFGFVGTLPVVFAEFMLAPFPWQVGNLLDVYALFESILRVALIFSAITAWRQATGKRRSQLAFLLWLYVAMELLWSLGTVNWGTAIRHHIPGTGLLLCIGGPELLRRVARRFRVQRPVGRMA